MFEELSAAGISPDLIYAPKTWLALLQWVQQSYPGGPCPEEEPQLLYVHTGGQQGVPPMLARYQALR